LRCKVRLTVGFFAIAVSLRALVRPAD
jgi:hypothetical protein